MLTQLAELTEKIIELENRLDNAPKDFAPPIGTYIYSKTDPSDTWVGTTWEQLTGGMYLTSSDTTLTIGKTYGANAVTLTTDNIPAHTHSMAHTHTGPSHTHSGPSHTHSVSGTAASAGAHTHSAKMPYGKDWGNGSQWSAYSSAQYPNWTLEVSSSGAHTHSVSGTAAAAGTGQTGASGTGTTSGASTSNTGSTGKTQSFNNMPKSIAIPLWTRTS